jgi:hypothetical protein
MGDDPSVREVLLDAGLLPLVLTFNVLMQIESQLQDPIRMDAVLNSVMRFHALRLP